MERRHDSPPSSWRERESCIFSQLTSSRIPMTRAFLLAIAAFIVAPMPQVRKPVCAPDNAGLTLQPGFCALIVAESIGPSRHMVVLENGDVLVAVYGPRGGVRVLRDTTGDGKADVISSFGIGGGNGPGGQTEADGRAEATGVANAVAVAVDPATGSLCAAQHVRDQVAANWPKLYADAVSAELPAEVVCRLEAGGDYGWPYCYYDWRRRQNVLQPEYGGDGKTQGRCDSAPRPVVAFPGHWAPDGMTFYNARHFPLKYRGGLFIAFHGSWNRAPEPQAGYKVMFVPIARGVATGPSGVFADGFAGATVAPQGARYRPTGGAVGPEGGFYGGAGAGAGAVFRIVAQP